ncbi:MAG: hypothetical protein U9O54_03275, partial [Chloroflexota bacterium]|nr:hypothetical protein [Chloroflexota bacterium]
NYEKYPKLQALLVDSIDKKLADPDVQFHFSMYKDEKTGKQVISNYPTTKLTNYDTNQQTHRTRNHRLYCRLQKRISGLNAD